MISIGWLICSIAVGTYADRVLKRSGLGWFVLSLLFSPLLMFILAVAIGKNHDVVASSKTVTEFDDYGDPVQKTVMGDQKWVENNAQTSITNPADIYINSIKIAFELYLKNILTREEYSKKKIEALILFENAPVNEDSIIVLTKLVPLIEKGAIDNYDIQNIKRKLGMGEVA